MADAKITNKPQPIKNVSSMLGKGISSLSRAIEDEARDAVSSVGNFSKDPGTAVNTVLDIGSTGIGLADALGAGQFNPMFMGAKAAYDAARWGQRYQDQGLEDRAKWGDESSWGGRVLRSAPLIGGIASWFGGDTTRPDLDPAFRNYLAQRGVNINDWRGGNQIGDTLYLQNPSGNNSINPASQRNVVTRSDLGPPAAPWINPNETPNPNAPAGFGPYANEDYGDWSGYSGEEGVGGWASGGIASLRA